MALRGPHRTLLLTLALLVACLALAGGQRWNALNDKFRRKHVDFPKSTATSNNTYCKKMMWNRVLYFKPTNTFIHAPNEDINKICTTDGLASGPYQYVSNSPFNITICSFNPLGFYYTGISAAERIVVTCLHGLPAFYVKHM